MTLGGTFQQDALDPIHTAEQMFRRQQVRSDRLAPALAGGVRARRQSPLTLACNTEQ
jgi:hypothetical protein